jgi:phage-related protein
MYTDLHDVDFCRIAEAAKIALSERSPGRDLAERLALELKSIPISELDLEEIAPLGFSITDPLGQLAEIIANLLKSVASWIVSAVESIVAPIRASIDSIAGALARVPLQILDLLRPSFEALWESIASVLNNIKALALQVADLVTTLARMAGDMLAAISSVGRALEDALRRAVEALTNSIGQLVELAIARIVSTIGTVNIALSRIVEAFGSMIISLVDKLREYLGEIVAALERMGDQIVTAIGSAVQALERTLKEVTELLWNSIRELVEKTASGLVAAVDAVKSALAETVETIGNTIVSLVGKVEEHLAALGDVIASFYGWMQRAIGVLEQYLDYTSHLAHETVSFVIGFSQGLTGVAVPVIPPPEALFAEGAPAPPVLQQIGQAIGSFFSGLVAPFDAIRKFFERVAEFFTDPLKWLQENLIAPLWSALQSFAGVILGGLAALGEVILSALRAAGNALVELFKSFSEWIYGVFSSLAGWMVDAVRGLYSSAVSIGWSISRFFIDVVLKLVDNVAPATTNIIGPLAQSFFSQLGLRTVPYLTAENLLASWIGSQVALLLFSALPLSTAFELRAASYVVRGIGYAIARTPAEIEINLRPLGLGTSIRLDLSKSLASALVQFGEELTKLGDEYLRALWLGFGIWFGRYLMLWWNYYFRNFIPIEFPTLKEIEEAWLRARVAEKLPEDIARARGDLMDGILYYLKIRGYSDFLIRYWYAEPYEFYTTLVDRFYIQRIVPLSGVWKLPSVADIAKMWVRDVLRPPVLEPEKMVENLTKVYEAAGLYRDIGLLYTLLAFRYPSPGDLADFYWRGMARAYWLTDSLEEPEWRRLFSIPDTWRSLAPYELNFHPERAKILNTLISLYMRWHDYFPVAWHPNFPTDKAIEVELTAELPGRLDLRWLTRWGIFQHLADAGVPVMADLETIFESFTKLTGEETRSAAVTPEIKLDARFLSRFLIARKTNPLVAPLVSVAQVHAVLASELTVLRTGFIDALRRGFITLDLSEELMSGLIKVKFLTGYIDTETGEFRDIVYTKPVMWLPAERRLLQLRAVFDRYNFLLRDLVSRSVRAVAWIAITPEEALSMVRELHPILAEHTRQLVKKISGIDWKPQLDEEYIGVWIQYAGKLRTIGARTWIRRHISRLMGWVLYRIVYGWVSPEELSSFVESISEIEVDGKKIKVLSDEEAAFFEKIAEKLYDLVRRELVPTPSSLASLAEYIDIESAVVQKVLQHYKVPPPFDKLYESYIRVRPVKSDFKTLLTKARSALIRRAITEEEWKEYLKRAVEYGFTDREIEIIREIAELEEKISDVRAWAPSVLTLISISEIVPRAVELLREYPVRQAFRELIEEYAKKKPVADDLRVLVSAYYRAKRYAALVGAEIPKEVDEKILKIFTEYGLTQEEMEIRDIAVMLEVLVEEFREALRARVPTPLQLATLSEYVEVPLDLVRESLERHRIHEKFRPIFLQYIAVRPLADDARALLSAYLRAERAAAIYGTSLPEDLVKTALDVLRTVGVTDTELAVRKLALQFEVLAEEIREWVPTPSTIAALSEYVVIPRDLVESALRVRRVPEEWISIWLQYIAAKPVKAEYRAVIGAALRALRYGAISRELWESILKSAAQYGFTQAELDLVQQRAELELLIEEARAWRPTLTTLITMLEYVPEAIELLKEYRIDPVFAPVVERYAMVKPLVDEFRALLNTYYRFYMLFEVPHKIVEVIDKYSKALGFTEEELRLRGMRAWLEWLAELWSEWRLTPARLATLAEYVPIDIEIVDRYLRFAPIAEDEKELWIKYIMVRPLADDARALMTAYYRAKRYAARYGQTIPEDLEKTIVEYLKAAGVTEVEMKIRDLAEHLEVLVDMWRAGELVPTLGMLATMAEYVEVPSDYVVRVLQLRRVEPTYAVLWLQYIMARTIASEVNRVVTAFTTLYTRFSVPEDLAKMVTELMRRGGWTPAEMEIFVLELYIRRLYRTLTLLVPTVRQFLADGVYLPKYEALLEDLFKTYGLSVETYRAQLEYYKKLLKNRRLWRHFSWYRSQLTYAFQRGAITEAEARKALQKFVDAGLIDQDELEIIIEGMKLRALGYATAR